MNKKENFKMKKFFKFIGGVIVAIILIGFFMDSSSSDTSLAEIERKALSMSIEEFKETAISVSYDELKRNPDNYKGKLVITQLYVAQIVSDKQWRTYTYGNNQWTRYDTEEEFYVFDKRKTGENIIEKDIITVYGVYRGTTSVRRALTGTRDSIPSIDVINLELKK